MIDEPLPPASDGGRLSNGQFGQRNSFGKGNPHLKRIAALRARLFEAVDDDAMTRVTKKLVELAESGDLEAIKLMFAYTIGKPDSVVQLMGADGGPIAVGNVTLQRGAVEIEAWRRTMTEKLLTLTAPGDDDDDQ